MSANGKVCTGFSKPWVAKYAANAGAVTYSGARVLARGVGVSIEPESSDDNNFYADNVQAESASGIFTGGSVTVTVDGLFMSAERFIMGLPDADTDGFTHYGDDQETPYVGFGYIARYMSGGITTYVPTVLAKIKFQHPGSEANTQEEEIDWQTQELEATIMRADDENHNWKYVGAEYPTEAEAETALKKKLGINSYSVTQTLTNATSSLTDTAVEEGKPLETTLTASDGYALDTPTVTMGGTDITSTAWDSAAGKVTIASVTGDVVITAGAHKEATLTFKTSYGSPLFDLYLNGTSVSWSDRDAGNPMAETPVAVKQGDIIKVFVDCTATDETDASKINRWVKMDDSDNITELGTGNTLTYTVAASDVDEDGAITLGFNGTGAGKGETNAHGYYYYQPTGNADGFTFTITTEA